MNARSIFGYVFAVLVFGVFAQEVCAYYAPEVGRFVSRDPIGYNAGDANLQRYAGNNTYNLQDPSGLDVWVEGTHDMAGIHQRVCVDVPRNCKEASCEEQGKPYCITFYKDGGGGGGCSNSSSGSSSSCSQKSGGAGGNDGKFKNQFNSALPEHFTKNPKGSGIIGPDNKPPSQGSENAAASSDSPLKLDIPDNDACEVYKYFKSMEDTRGNYRPFCYNCRHFSQDIYKKVEQKRKQ